MTIERRRLFAKIASALVLASMLSGCGLVLAGAAGGGAGYLAGHEASEHHSDSNN